MAIFQRNGHNYRKRTIQKVNKKKYRIIKNAWSSILSFDLDMICLRFNMFLKKNLF